MIATHNGNEYPADPNVMPGATDIGLERAQRDLSGPQPPAEDIRNAIQILLGLANAPRFWEEWLRDRDDAVRLLNHALAQLEGSL